MTQIAAKHRTLTVLDAADHSSSDMDGRTTGRCRATSLQAMDGRGHGVKPTRIEPDLAVGFDRPRAGPALTLTAFNDAGLDSKYHVPLHFLAR